MRPNLLFVHVIILILLMLGTSCKKKKYCSSDLELICPATVVEGENIDLSVINLPSEEYVNTYYYWKFADMSSYSSTVDGMVETYDAAPVTIYDVDLRDEGIYAFHISSGYDDCPDMTTTRKIKVIPKTSPCFNSVPIDTLIIEQSFTSGTIYQSYIPIIDVALFGDDFEIELGMPMFTYFMKFVFDVPVPDRSRTFKLRNFYQNMSDGSVEDDPFVQVEVNFNPDNDVYNSYRVAENQENLYVKIEGDSMILTFCELLFTHSTIPGRTITISGKVKVQI